MTGRRYSKLLILVIGILLLSAIGLSACSQASPTAPVQTPPAQPPPPVDQTSPPQGQPTQTPVTAQVTLSNFAFSPTTVVLPVGSTVIWTNKDSVTHTVTSNSGLFDSGNLAQGKTFSFTFNQAGTFQYLCNLHPSMTGKITVVEASTAPPASGTTTAPTAGTTQPPTGGSTTSGNTSWSTDYPSYNY